MALSIGATTTLFSLAYGVLMRPLPWPEPDRLVRLQETRGGRVSRVPWTISNAAYLAWRDQPATVEDIGGWFRSRPMTLSSESEPERFLVGGVTPSLMRVLRARPLIGRVFMDSDDGPGRPNLIVLGFDLWQRRFAGRNDIVGELVRLDGQPYTVIGVMPRDFAFPNRETQAWTRLGVAPVLGQNGVISLMMFSAMARLRPGVTPEQVEAEGTARARGAPDLKQTALALFGNNGPAGMTAMPARDVMTAEVRPALLILLAAVALLFLASTASLIVLQLSRVARRAREIAVRTAIGAGNARLVRQWIVESSLLGMAGAASGLLMATLLHRGLPAVLPAGFPRVDDVRLDWRVAMFACAVAMLVSLACGMVPAFRSRRHALTEALVEGAASTPRSHAYRGSPCSNRVHGGTGCGGVHPPRRRFAPRPELHGASRRRSRVRSAWPSDHAPAAAAADDVREADGAARSPSAAPGGSAERHRRRLRKRPSVCHGGHVPRDDHDPAARSINEGRRPDDHSRRQPRDFRAMRLRVVQGRAIDRSDIESSAKVMVVNETFAAQYLGDRPLGQRLNMGLAKFAESEVVGVVDDMRQGTNSTEPSSTFGGVLDLTAGDLRVASAVAVSDRGPDRRHSQPRGSCRPRR